MLRVEPRKQNRDPWSYFWVGVELSPNPGSTSICSTRFQNHYGSGASLDSHFFFLDTGMSKNLSSACPHQCWLHNLSFLCHGLLLLLNLILMMRFWTLSWCCNGGKIGRGEVGKGTLWRRWVHLTCERDRNHWWSEGAWGIQFLRYPQWFLPPGNFLSHCTRVSLCHQENTSRDSVMLLLRPGYKTYWSFWLHCTHPLSHHSLSLGETSCLCWCEQPSGEVYMERIWDISPAVT